MFLALDSDEQEIANAAAGFLGGEFPLRRLHLQPQDPRNLQPLASLGWLGLAASEEVGGSGLSIVEEMLFFLEHGRVAGPIEVLAQVLAVAVARDDAALCSSLVGGETAAALLVQWSEDGEIRVIGDQAAEFVVHVMQQSSVLFRWNAGVCEQVMGLDRSTGMFAGNAGCLEAVSSRGGDSVWKKAQVNVAAMMVGLAESALAMIVEYAKERETFGRAIGAYQAVRHPCADMAVRVEAARSQLYYAATALREGHGDAAMQVDAAKLLAAKAAMLNTDTNIQLHGGIGVTDEHDAHLLMKRANLLGRLFGSGKQLRHSLLELSAIEGAA